MDYQDVNHYAEAYIGGSPEDEPNFPWRAVAANLFSERDSIAAIIAQWEHSEEGDVDALIRISNVIND